MSSKEIAELLRATQDWDHSCLSIEACSPQILSELPDTHDELSKEARKLEDAQFTRLKRISQIQATFNQLHGRNDEMAQHIRKDIAEQLKPLTELFYQNQIRLRHAYAKIKDKLGYSSQVQKENSGLEKEEIAHVKMQDKEILQVMNNKNPLPTHTLALKNYIPQIFSQGPNTIKELAKQKSSLDDVSLNDPIRPYELNENMDKLNDINEQNSNNARKKAEREIRLLEGQLNCNHQGLKVDKDSISLDSSEYLKDYQGRDRFTKIKKDGKAIDALIELLQNCSKNEDISELIKGNPVFDSFFQFNKPSNSLDKRSELEKDSQNCFTFPFLIQDQNDLEILPESMKGQQPSYIPRIIVKSQQFQDIRPLTIETCRPQILSFLPDDYRELSKKTRSLEGEILTIYKEISSLKNTVAQLIDESDTAANQLQRKEAEEQIKELEKKLRQTRFVLKHADAKIRDCLSSFPKGHKAVLPLKKEDTRMQGEEAQEELLKKIRYLADAQLKAMMEIQEWEQKLNEPLSPIAATQHLRKEAEEQIKKLEEKVYQSRIALDDAYAKAIDMFSCLPFGIQESELLKKEESPSAHE